MVDSFATRQWPAALILALTLASVGFRGQVSAGLAARPSVAEIEYPAQSQAATAIVEAEPPPPQAPTQAPAQPAASEPATTASAPPPPAAPPPPPPIPQVKLLNPMSHAYQTWNNCAPVATMMALSYYGINKSQPEIAQALRPNPKNFSVRGEQVVKYVAGFDLRGRALLNGNVGLLQQLVAAGIPVLVEDQLGFNRDEDYGHYRTVRGYNREFQLLIVNDPYFGPSRPMREPEFVELWRRHNRRYIPIYRPEQEEQVRAILGVDAEPEGMLRRAREELTVAAQAKPGDGFAWLDLGEVQTLQGDFAVALESWRNINQASLAPRTLWYTSWPAVALNQIGQAQAALELSNRVLSVDPGNAEYHRERGKALLALGQPAAAREAFERARFFDPSLEDVPR